MIIDIVHKIVCKINSNKSSRIATRNFTGDFKWTIMGMCSIMPVFFYFLFCFLYILIKQVHWRWGIYPFNCQGRAYSVWNIDVYQNKINIIRIYSSRVGLVQKKLYASCWEYWFFGVDPWRISWVCCNLSKWFVWSI